MLSGFSPAGFARIGPVTVRAAVVGKHVHLTLRDVETPAAAGLAAAARWGRDRGARWAVLQVDPGDEAARAGWLAQGFRPHHRVRYVSPGGAD